MRRVRFYFDFISPYSYLASQLIARDEALQAQCEYIPIVFGSVLSTRGVKGPGEIPSRRFRGLQDALLVADSHNIPLDGPAKHPFNPIYALRSVTAISDPDTRARITTAYYRAGWAEGGDLGDPDFLQSVLHTEGVEQNVEEAATDRSVRSELKKATKDFMAHDGWGVPSFLLDDVLLFGQDRLDILRALLRGELKPDNPRCKRLLNGSAAT